MRDCAIWDLICVLALNNKEQQQKQPKIILKASKKVQCDTRKLGKTDK